MPKNTGRGSSHAAGYTKLMELGRAVIDAERLFGEGSVQHKRAVAAWQAQQKKMGVRA